MQDIPVKKFYRPDELARELGYSTETVSRWLRKGLVKYEIRNEWRTKAKWIPREEFFRVLQHGVSGR